MATVLIVDDSSLDQQIAAACVQQSGCDAEFASDGAEALASLEQARPDVVLTDLQMPELDGLELVKRIRASDPRLPVILMTAFGSEDVAVKALQAGASSYVPKKDLKKGLSDALRVVLSAVNASQQRDQVRASLLESQTRFVLGYEEGGPQALIGYFRDGLDRLNFCSQSTTIQISTALIECIRNAIDHGNLELDSKLRESEDDSYHELGEERAGQPPFRDRKVRVTATLTPSEARFVIRDEGPGFDPSTLPDPLDPENLLKPHGRGIMLMRTFLDEVSFNESGNEVTLVKRREASDN